MNKILLGIIPFIFLGMGCASKLVPAETTLEIPPGHTIQELAELIESGEITYIPELPVVTEAEPELQSGLKFPRVGMWKVRGQGQQGNWTADLVIDEIDDNSFSGNFAWRGGFDGRSGGTEYFSGIYDPPTRKLSLQGTRLARARGISIDRYEAFLALDGKNFVLGSWSEGGRWEAGWVDDQQ